MTASTWPPTASKRKRTAIGARSHTPQAIGHKKIDIFPAVTATAVRLTLLDSNGPAQIREFQVYNGGVPY